MRRSDFHYDLPAELIAQAPLPERSASRMLMLDGRDGVLQDRRFLELPGLLRPGDLLIFNDTRVLRARLQGRKPSGGRVELLLERPCDATRGLFQAKASKPLRAGATLELAGGGRAHVLGRQDDLFELEFAEPLLDYLARHGEVPLPPYIDRGAADFDSERYQTVFACTPGAVAAPTAGLHFDAGLLDALAAAGVQQARITLHVGAGTFQPLRVDDPAEHRMHSERVEVSAATCEAVAATRARGGRVVAIGTTVVRSLEAAFRDGAVQPLAGETALFIRPGFRFQAVDALLTNFHLPESTLLMLVCAFGGERHVLAAYRHAVRERYRFFSYGDAMFVTPQPAARGLAP